MSKNPFIEYVKVWRKENPEVGYKDALKSASIDYKKMDKPAKVQTVKQPKTKEQKDTKNNRAKLIRDFKKLETSISSGNIANYDDFIKIGNVLRGKSTTNSYAKKLRLIERKIKSKKFQTLQKKTSKEDSELQKKIADNKKTKAEIDLENVSLNKDKSTAKMRKEERIAKRKRALKLIKNPNGTRKYSDAQIDQMLKLEEEGLSTKDIKATTTALGKYLKDDYLKEFKRLNPTFNDYRAKDYLIRNKNYEKDPYNIPVVTDATELANANKPKPLPPAPPLPTIPIPPTTPAVKPLKLTKKNQDLRKKLLEDFGLDNTQLDISNLDVDLTKDLYFGQNDGFESNRDAIASKTQITKKRREIKRLLNAYGSNRGVTYGRLQDIDELLEDYETQLQTTKKLIKKDEKQEKLQIEDLIDNILKDATDKAEDISKKVEAKKDETLTVIKTKADKKKAKEDAEKAKKDADDKEKQIQQIKDKIEQDKKDKEAQIDAIKADKSKKASEKREAEKKLKEEAKELKKKQEDEIKKLGKEKKEKEKLERQEKAKQEKLDKALEKAKKDAQKPKPKPPPIPRQPLPPPTPKPPIPTAPLPKTPTPQTAGGKNPIFNPTAPVFQPKRNKTEIQTEIDQSRDNIQQLLRKIDMIGVTTQVSGDLEQALQTNDFNFIVSNVRPIFEGVINSGVVMEGDTAQALKDGDISKFSRLYQQDPIIQVKINLIVKEILANTKKDEYDEIEKQEARIVELETELGGAGFGGGSLVTHLEKAEEYFTSGKMSEHANLVRRHIKMAKKIIDNLPSSENVDKIKTIVDMADDILN